MGISRGRGNVTRSFDAALRLASIHSRSKAASSPSDKNKERRNLSIPTLSVSKHNCQLTCHRKQLSSRHSQHLISGSSPCPHRCLKAWLKGDTFRSASELTLHQTREPLGFSASWIPCVPFSISFEQDLEWMQEAPAGQKYRKEGTKQERTQMELRPGANFESHGQANF
ncbi:hypothetical protein MUK42_32788 [Musa troglodytarum]|uniref:Uncharacterized protein n=1 Tax=Musa troglodytarum TaxID=320322 RepID=A0A9E7JTK8_9LILI|nr:hypothetical protein MUK42_32788 [Musa troglodytarum]